MLNIKQRTVHSVGWLLAFCVTLAGCASKTNVSLTGDLPAQYTHAFITTQEIWFDTNANAGPDDTTWNKFTLVAPVTVDLASATNGTLTQIATTLSVPAGTYNEVRLIPIDSSTSLVSSAQALGAIYNSEVDYVDSSGTTYQVPLELQNPDKGIGIATTLTISANYSGTLSGSTSSDTSSTTGTTATGTTATTSTTTTGTSLTSSTDTTGDTTVDTTGTATVAPVTLAVFLNGATDLVPFTYGNVNAVLLNPHSSAYNTSAVGAIEGALTITGLTGITSTNGQVNIQVTAESLSTDGSRHVAIASAPVQTDGSFVLYPLTTSASSAASYDLVIHGPGIQTIIVKGVTVSVGDPSTTTPTSIGTLTPQAASSFAVNLSATNPVQAGSLVGFYQSLPASGEVPYLIEQWPIDPFNFNFASNQSLSSGALQFGTFVSGSTVTLSSATASEGAATFRVSASAPLFTDGPLTTMISAPSASSSSAVLAAPAALAVASGATSVSASFAVSAATIGKYNAGELIVSQNGAIVATASLNTLLAAGGTGTITILGLPGGNSSTLFNPALYYVSVRAWNTSNPSGTLSREIYPNVLNLTAGSVTGFTVIID